MNREGAKATDKEISTYQRLLLTTDWDQETSIALRTIPSFSFSEKKRKASKFIHSMIQIPHDRTLFFNGESLYGSQNEPAVELIPLMRCFPHWTVLIGWVTRADQATVRSEARMLLALFVWRMNDDELLIGLIVRFGEWWAGSVGYRHDVHAP